MAGGAEVINEELAKRLVADGHEVVFLVRGVAGTSQKETKNGFKIIRVGSWRSVYIEAYRYYKKHLRNWPDLIISEINTIPFFSKFFVKQRNILIIYQLARKIWFYQMFFPLNLIGYILEPVYLWFLKDRKVITISESTKKDLMRFGFREENISIIPVGIEFEPIKSFEAINKFEKPTILSHGAIRPMKRTAHIVQAFEIAKEDVLDLELIISGDSSSVYGEEVLNLIKNSKYSDSIKYLGRVDDAKKIELMQRAHLIAVTSVKEGWGIIVTEANSQGTPAVVYNVDGLRDSVKNYQTGLICGQNTPEDLAEEITLLLKNPKLYKTLQKNGWKWSKEINFENSYKQFISKINE